MAELDPTQVNLKMIMDEALKTTSLAHAKVIERSDVLFEALMSQQAQLFSVALATLSNNATITTKALDISAIEVSEEAIAAKIAADVFPELLAALKVLLAELVAEAARD